MVCLQAALAEQLFDIAERERVPQVPVHGAKNQLGLGLSHLKISGRIVFFMISSGYQSPLAKVATHPVVQISDLVVIPTKPSPHDLRAVVGTVELVEKYDKPMVFVINAAVMRARLTGQAAVALSQYGTVAPITVHHRVDFAASMIDGRVAREINGKSRSAEEIASLWKYVTTRIRKVKKDD